MRVRRIKVRNHYLEDRAAHLLAVVEAFASAGRPVPGHVLREIVTLRPNWGRHRMPAVVQQAANKLQRCAK